MITEARATWPWTRQRRLTPLERANLQWARSTEAVTHGGDRRSGSSGHDVRLKDPSQEPAAEPAVSPGVLELRREFRPKQRPPVQATKVRAGEFDPLGEFPLVSVDIADRMYVDSFVSIAARRLGVSPAPWVEFYKAPRWAHRGAYTPKASGTVYVRVGQTMAHTIATALHETAHFAGIDDEGEAEAFAQQSLRDSIYASEARLAVADDPLCVRWAEHLRSKGVEA